MSAPGPSRWPVRVSLVALALLPIVLLVWSWGQWADVQIDFGRELYAAWRLTEGDRLYGDMAWFNGPLSAHWNALWLGAFGVSLRALALVNLGVVYAALALLWVLVRRWSSPIAATAVGVVFLTTFAFGQNVGVGNYCFIAPYSHEIVHGFVLSLGALAALQRLGRVGRERWAFVAGCALGLAFLTKAEVFVAGAIAVALRLGLYLAGDARRARTLVLFGLGATLPVVVAYLALAAQLPAGTAGRAVLGSWAYATEGEVRGLLFYRTLIGTDRLGTNLTRLAVWGVGTVAVVGAATWIARRVTARYDSNLVVSTLVFALGFGLCAVAVWKLEWKNLARPYPVYAAATALVCGRLWLKARSAAAADQLAFAALAGVLLLKVLFNTRLEHYGFVLALPTTALVVAALVDHLPRLAARSGGSGRMLRAAFLGGLCALVGARLDNSNRWFEHKQHSVGGARDPIRVGGRARTVQALLDDLGQRLGPDDTLLVLPEGVMLNYLLRRESPTPFVNFMPPELIFWGEQPVVYALEENPPDVVVVLHKDTREDYGVGWFGSPGFGEKIMSWVRSRYAVGPTYGHEPLTADYKFGAQVWVPKPR